MALISLINEFLFGYKYYVVTYVVNGRGSECLCHSSVCTTKQQAQQVYDRLASTVTFFPLYIETFRSRHVYNDPGHTA